MIQWKCCYIHLFPCFPVKFYYQLNCHQTDMISCSSTVNSFYKLWIPSQLGNYPHLNCQEFLNWQLRMKRLRFLHNHPLLQLDLVDCCNCHKLDSMLPDCRLCFLGQLLIDPLVYQQSYRLPKQRKFDSTK